LTQWCQKGEAIQLYLCSSWLATPHHSYLGSGGCHDNTVVEVLEMYCDIQKCITMYYLTISMATAKQPEAVKCVAYENSSPWCILKLKTVQKSPLCICNDMLIYGLIFKKGLSKYRYCGAKRVKPYKFILCLGWLTTLHLPILGCGGCHDNTVVKVVMTTQL